MAGQPTAESEFRLVNRSRSAYEEKSHGVLWALEEFFFSAFFLLHVCFL